MLEPALDALKGKLGRRRYVVERTMSWFDGFRKIRIRDERKIEHFQALHSIACIHICFNQLQRLRTAYCVNITS